MTKGPTPTSNAEKVAKGTLQPCRARRTVVVAGRLADPPDDLPKAAKAAWRLALETAPDGMLTALDASLLERWSRTYALYRKAAKEIEQQTLLLPSGKINPALTALLRIQATLSTCEKELGFTPTSRARVQASDDDVVQENPFEQF